MTNRPAYLKNVTTLALSEELCVGCGMCEIVCPHGVMVLENGKAAVADRDACMECGACAQNCPTGAIFVQTGVGCAVAVINTALCRASGQCCCVIKPGTENAQSSKGASCC
jgi:NAD-dependent dihydropyrimidine dehydrogenase PreA subunit